MKVRIITFGKNNGNLTEPYDLLLDCNKLSNPYNTPRLRSLKGTDGPVKRYMLKDERAVKVLRGAIAVSVKYADSDEPADTFTIAFRCHGGQHRSVALGEILGTMLEQRDIPHTIKHRDMQKEGEG